MTFQELFPGAADFVTSIPKFGPIAALQAVKGPGGSAFNAVHLAGLALTGGCVILLCLRFMGVGLTNLSASRIEKSLRPWLIVGVALAIGSGLLIGGINAEKLYSSEAFYSKMMAMIAGLIFSFGVCNSVAKHEGEVTRNARIAAAVAAVFWLYSIDVFSFTQGLNPGMFHIVTAGFAILGLVGSRTRWIGLGAFGAMCFAIFAMYFVVGMDSQDQIYLDIGKYALIAAAVLLVALLAYELHAGRADAATPVARVIALFTILSWVTVGAGGRWIGLS
jgi:hypothetical protein